MPRMKAAIFVEPGRIVLESKPVPDVGPLDALVRVTTTTICGTDVHILKGEYPVRKGLTIGHEPVGVIEKLVPPYRATKGPAGHRWRHHAERQQLCLPVRPTLAGRRRHASRLQGDRRLEARQHHRRLPGRDRLRARRHRRSLAGAGCLDRRAGADVSGHHVDRLLRCRKRWHPHRRHRGGVRAGADRLVYRGRRPADGRRRDHRRRQRARTLRHGARQLRHQPSPSTSSGSPIKNMIRA